LNKRNFLFLLENASQAKCFNKKVFKPEILTSIRCSVRFSFVHDARRALNERAITNVGMPDNPSHIGGYPPNRIFV